MRVAALYDVHGNLPALEAVLADVETLAVDRIVVGGDAVAGPWPRETLARLRSLGERTVWVRGNHERGLAGSEDEWPPAVWARDLLGPEERAWLASLPEQAMLDVDGLGRVLFCHATPRSDEEIVTLVTPDEVLADALASTDADLVVAGHTHAQMDRTTDRVRYVNPGSVGMPVEGRPGAFWALLGDGVELRTSVYDVDAAVAALPEGFPDAEELIHECWRGGVDRLEQARAFERLAVRG